MDWNVNWLFWGGAAFLLAVINIVRGSLGRNRGWQLLMLSSMSCGLLSLLAELRMIGRWIDHGDMPALLDTVPGMLRILTAAVIIGICLNLFAVLINLSSGSEK